MNDFELRKTNLILKFYALKQDLDLINFRDHQANIASKLQAFCDGTAFTPEPNTEARTSVILPAYWTGHDQSVVMEATRQIIAAGYGDRIAFEVHTVDGSLKHSELTDFAAKLGVKADTTTPPPQMTRGMSSDQIERRYNERHGRKV